MKRFIMSDDIKLCLYDRGNIHSDTLLLFLHGGPGSGAKAIISLSAFQALEETYHCVYFDQRGCGESKYELRKGLAKEQLCSDVKLVVSDCRHCYKNKKIVLWGGSFGGLLACLYMEYEGAVDALVLSSPAITFDRKTAIERFQRNQLTMEKRLSQEKSEIPIFNDEPEIVLTNKEFRSFVFSEENPSNSLRHIAAMASWFYHYNAFECLRMLTLPTLIMIGRDDNICDANALQKSIDDIQNEYIEFHPFYECGHAIFEDQKECFVSTIQSFLSSHII